MLYAGIARFDIIGTVVFFGKTFHELNAWEEGRETARAWYDGDGDGQRIGGHHSGWG